MYCFTTIRGLLLASVPVLWDILGYVDTARYVTEYGGADIATNLAEVQLWSTTLAREHVVGFSKYE